MNFKKKFSLDDFFNDTFKQIGPVVKNTYAPLIVLLLPFSILYGLGMLKFFTGYFTFIMSLMDGTIQPDASFTGVFSQFMPYYGRFISIALVVGLVSSFATLIVIENMAQIMLPEREPKDFKTLAIGSLPRVILAGILQVLFIVGAEIAVVLVMALFIFLSTLFLKGLWIFLAVVLILAFIAAVIWIIFSFTLSTYLIVIEDAGAWASLKKSFQLVRHNWWRFFLISILFSLVVSFALSMVTTPLFVLTVLPSFSDFFNSVGSYMDEAELFFTLMEAFQSNIIGWIIGAVTFVELFVKTIFLNIFYSLFYMDLKVRKEEISAEEEKEIQ